MNNAPDNLHDLLDLLAAGMKEMAQSWREISITDPMATLATVKKSWQVIQERLQWITAAQTMTRAITERSSALVGEAFALEMLLEQIDLKLIPEEQLTALVGARGRLLAIARQVKDVLP